MIRPIPGVSTGPLRLSAVSAGAHSSATVESPSPRLPAWLRPVPVAATILIVTVLMANWMKPATYFSDYREPKYVNAGTVWWIVYLTIAFCVPAYFVAAERFGSQPWRSWELSPAEQRSLRRVVIGLFIPTMLGYLVWLGNAASHGFHFSAVGRLYAGTQSAETTKAQLKTVAGVTTMTQFGIALVVIAAILWPKATKDVKIMTVIVLLLGLLRAYVASERLAVYELAVPMGVVIAARAYTGPGTPAERRRRRRIVRMLPVVALPLLILTFAGYEYSRSWQYYKHRTQDSFLVYEANRLAGYYSTSYNNAEMLRQTHLWPPPGAVPWMTWQGVWVFPVFKDVVHYDKLSGGANFLDVWSQAMDRYTNREFNLVSGITNPTFDYGMVGGGVFLAVVGGLVGGAYAAFAQRRRHGLLFYPILMVFMIELPREWYITGSGRAIPALIGALIAACVLRRIRHHEHRVSEQRSGRAVRKIGVAQTVGELEAPSAPA